MEGMRRLPAELDTTEEEETTRIVSNDFHEFDPLPSTSRDAPLQSFKFVDDLIGIEKLSISHGYRLMTTKKQEVHLHERKCEDFFSTVASNGKEVGLSVNEKKTQLLCVSTTSASNTGILHLPTKRRKNAQPR